MKIFSFTINLFDKYKYAIKVMLFLLKNLVNKDPTGPGGEEKVNIPYEIIPDIKKLLLDQKTVQGVIDKMKTVISPDKEEPIDTYNVEGRINKKLRESTSPINSPKGPPVTEPTIDEYLPEIPRVLPPTPRAPP